MTSSIEKPIENSPFFALMSDAERIQVEEVPQSAAAGPSERTFLVRIQARPHSSTSLGDSSNPDQILDNAELLLKNGDTLLARNLFSFALRKNLKNERAMEGLGACFLKLNEIMAAKKCFKALWEIHQKSSYAVQLALCYLNEQNEEAALSLFEQVKEDSVQQWELKYEFYKGFGNVLTRKCRFAEAESCYQKALMCVPNSLAVMVNLGMLKITQERFKEASDWFQKALALDPMHSKASCGMGMIHFQENRVEKAIECFQKALDCNKANAVALQYLIRCLEFSNSKENLFSRISEFLKTEPNHGEIRFQFARLLMQESRFSEASEQSEKALKLLPQDPRVGELKKILIQNRHRGAV